MSKTDWFVVGYKFPFSPKDYQGTAEQDDQASSFTVDSRFKVGRWNISLRMLVHPFWSTSKNVVDVITEGSLSSTDAFTIGLLNHREVGKDFSSFAGKCGKMRWHLFWTTGMMKEALLFTSGKPKNVSKFEKKWIESVKKFGTVGEKIPQWIFKKIQWVK